ncbi:MAG: hypothetical protein CL912_28110 [Deltaproteobacteria bacterium]|nr:hypothetical protein [Deltaproteobacteria bacterium]
MPKTLQILSPVSQLVRPSLATISSPIASFPLLLLHIAAASGKSTDPTNGAAAPGAAATS